MRLGQRKFLVEEATAITCLPMSLAGSAEHGDGLTGLQYPAILNEALTVRMTRQTQLTGRAPKRRRAVPEEGWSW